MILITVPFYCSFISRQIEFHGSPGIGFQQGGILPYQQVKWQGIFRTFLYFLYNFVVSGFVVILLKWSTSQKNAQKTLFQWYCFALEENTNPKQPTKWRKTYRRRANVLTSYPHKKPVLLEIKSRRTLVLNAKTKPLLFLAFLNSI